MLVCGSKNLAGIFLPRVCRTSDLTMRNFQLSTKKQIVPMKPVDMPLCDSSRKQQFQTTCARVCGFLESMKNTKSCKSYKAQQDATGLLLQDKNNLSFEVLSSYRHSCYFSVLLKVPKSHTLVKVIMLKYYFGKSETCPTTEEGHMKKCFENSDLYKVRILRKKSEFKYIFH